MANARSYIGLLTFSAILIFLMVVVPQSIGLGKGGFTSESILQTFFFYAGPAGIFLFGLVTLFFIEKAITKGDSLYGSGLGFYDTGETPALPIPFFKNPVALLLLSLIVFMFLGLVSFVFLQGQAFTGIGHLEQQFTKTDNIIFNLFLAVPSENIGAGFVLAFMIFTLRALARRFKMNKSNFILLALLLAFIVIGIYGIINHSLRYQDSDTALTTVFFFWGIGGLMTTLIGNAIPFLVVHAVNNSFGDLKVIYGDTLTIYIIIIIAILIGLYGFLFLRKR